MKAYLIDPENRTLSAVDVTTENGSQLKSMYRHLDCDLVEIVRDVIPGHDIWIDEEGALYEEPPHGLFYAAGHPQQIFCGRALVMSSDDEGDTTPATCQPEEILERIRAVAEIDHSQKSILLAPLTYTVG